MKHLRRAGGDYAVDHIGVETGLRIKIGNLIEQIARSRDWRVAAKCEPFEGSQQLARKSFSKKEAVGCRADDQRSATPVDKRYLACSACQAMHDHGAFKQHLHLVKAGNFVPAFFIHALARVKDKRMLLRRTLECPLYIPIKCE